MASPASSDGGEPLLRGAALCSAAEAALSLAANCGAPPASGANTFPDDATQLAPESFVLRFPQLPAELSAWVRRCIQTERALAATEAKCAEQAAALRRQKSNEAPVGHPRGSTPGDYDEHASQGSGRSRCSDISSMPAGRMSPLGTSSNVLNRREAAGPHMIRLLLVEDDPFQADAILVLCEQCGYQAECASSAAEALAMVRAHPEINLVLSDVMMEGTSGYELLCRIRAIRSHVSVIMMSAYESIDLVQQCILSGADAYLLKPLRVHELTNIWQYVWRRRHELQLQHQVSALMASDRHGARQQTPDLGSVNKVKGARQRLTRERVPELTEATRQLDKLETVTTQQAERQIRDELRALVLEEPHTAGAASRQQPSASSAGSAAASSTICGGALRDGMHHLSGSALRTLDEVAEAASDGTQSEGHTPNSERDPMTPEGLSSPGSFLVGRSPTHPGRSPARLLIGSPGAGVGTLGGLGSGGWRASAPRARSVPSSPQAADRRPALAAVKESRKEGSGWNSSGRLDGGSFTSSESCVEPKRLASGSTPGVADPETAPFATSAGAAAYAAAMALMGDSDDDDGVPERAAGASGAAEVLADGPGRSAPAPPLQPPRPLPEPLPEKTVVSSQEPAGAAGPSAMAKPVRTRPSAALPPALQPTTICRLCEVRLPLSDLAFHLVHCTAAHTCHERVRQLDRALRLFGARIRKRQERMRAVFCRIEASLQPLESISAFCEAAGSSAYGAGEDGLAVATGATKSVLAAASAQPPSSAPVGAGNGDPGSKCTPGGESGDGDGNELDPIQQTYHLMRLQRMAEAKFVALTDPALIELAGQASRLASSKMEVYWDLLSLQDPRAPPSTRAPRAYSVSIKEYTLVEPIGFGGFATVWLARRRRTGDLSAIKVLSQADMRTRKMSAAVRLEKSILASADHPLVVKLLFSFATAKHMYMVMEYLPGGDCLTLLQSYGFFEEALARFFCAEALLGLQYLHENSIIHRDIKPSNFLITANGHIKLADFGLSAAEENDGTVGDGAAAVLASHEEVSAEGAAAAAARGIVATALVGTPDYLAPELLSRGGYGYEVDFWAIGVVLYQFLVGETPFYAGDDLQEMYRRILHLEYYVPEPPDDASEAAVDLLQKLLVLKPHERLGGSPVTSSTASAVTGSAAVLAHSFFAPLDIDADPPLWQRPSPFTPTLRHEADTSNFGVNELAKVHADRMRSQLEMDGSDEEKGKGKGVEEEGEEDGEDDRVGLSSFKTVNATSLARMQLQEGS